MPTILPDDSPLRIFMSNGLRFDTSNMNGEVFTTCPFCDREDKFYINSETGLFSCKVCGAVGNPIEFIRRLHISSQEYTTDADYVELARNRKYLSIEILKQYGFALNRLRDEWIVPGYYQNGDNADKPKNLYRWTDYGTNDGKKHLQSTKNCQHCLYGIRNWDDSKEMVYICEGPWDAMAIEEVLRITKLTDSGTLEYTGNEANSLYANINVIAFPSTTTINDGWLQLLQNKRVYLLGHNDYPRVINDKNGNPHRQEPASWQGYQRIIKKLEELLITPASIYYLHWGKDCKENTYNPNLKKGYDVRDLLAENYVVGLYDALDTDERIGIIENRLANLSQLLFNYLQPIPEQWSNPEKENNKQKKSNKHNKELTLALIPCNNWNDLIKQWDEVLIMHDGVRKTLSVMLAAIASVPVPKTQLWIRVISEPSTGKSMLCDAVCSNTKFVSMQSNITGFFSGMRPSKKQSEKGIDNLGLIDEINFKAFVTKDADPIIQRPDRPRIMGEARDLFDGKTSTHFRTGMGSKYPIIRTVWIMCGTNSVRLIDENDLGGRFLDCEIMRAITAKIKGEIIDFSIDSMFDAMDKRVTKDNLESLDTPEVLKAKKMTGGYIEYLCTKGRELMANILINTRKNGYQEFRQVIHNLAQFVAKMRTRPGKKDEFITEELPARLGEQLSRLAVCLATVWNKEKIDTQVLRTVAEIAFDTSRGSVFDMTKVLYFQQAGLTQETLWKTVKRHDKEYKELLRFLVRLKAFSLSDESKTSMLDGFGGARYTLSQELRGICDRVFPYMEHLL